MHAPAMTTTLRTAVLGSRMAGSALAPFAYSTAAPFSSFQQQEQQLQTQQRRAASSKSTCQSVFPVRSTSLSKVSQQRTQCQRVPASLRLLSTGSSPAANSPESDAARLDWNTFFQLRASRRRYSLGSSILASLASTAVGVQVLGTQDLDALGAQVMGLDPLVVLGLATAACGALGWLAGPFLGNAFWGLVHRKYRKGVAVKEKEFFDRIKKFRVDPSSNSFSNPVPDYYGEKIGSVRDYRQWLKDQRAYNRKRRSFV